MRHVCPVAGQSALPKRPPRGKRIRIGFVSSFFQLHSVARTTIGFIRDLPRERFEVHVFAIEPADDAMRRAVESAADVYVKLTRELAAIRRAIEDTALDVLVFADLGMDPVTYALALWRLAPLQAVSWGHSDTSGIDTIDCYLSARGVEIDAAQAHYTERLVRPDAFFLGGYERPRLAHPAGREALGLPAQARLYGCLQPVFKLHPDIDHVLGALLERDARAEIVLLESKAHAAALVRERFARTLGPLARRIRFLPALPMDRYVATLAAMDVALDPLYFGGCNSSCEALALGVPLVTLPGEHLYGRFTLGLYREMGIEDCVAASVDDYVERAHRLASDRDYRGAVSREIASRSGVLFDRKDITLAYADFFEDALARA
jgi:predicted O-linked N-acetylglucosamine transferase (SPINDLY family)